MKSIDITGQKFGKLTAVEFVEKRGKNNSHYWLFRCDCGNEKIIRKSCITSNFQDSCGYKCSLEKRESKICPKCKLDKSNTEFKFNKKKNKYHSYCIKCEKKYHSIYGKNNRLKWMEYHRVYQIYWRKIDKKNKNKKRLESLHNNVHQNLKNNVSRLLRLRLKQRLLFKNNKSTWLFLPYTVDELKQHLESKFQIGMSWDNYGFYGWHIDHIRPDSSFNYTSVEDDEFKKCWALNNLQPLWATDNLRKSNKYYEPILYERTTNNTTSSQEEQENN